MTSLGLPADSPEQEREGMTHTHTHTRTLDKSGLCTEQREVLKESILTSPLFKSFKPSITHSDSADRSISAEETAMNEIILHNTAAHPYNTDYNVKNKKRRLK